MEKTLQPLSPLTNAFGGLQVRLDPWQPDYGPEFAALDEASATEGDETVDLDIELPGSAWHPVQPPATGLTTGTVWFIDGVRRLEARVTAQADGRYCHGAFGSYAVGAVRLDAREAGFDRHITGRLFALASALQPGGELQVAPGLVYLPLRVAGSEPEAPLRAIHNEMRLAEETLAREVASSETGLVVMDGPLTFEEATRSAAVGYIKRILRTYLPPAQLAILPRLKTGERTPLFALQASRRFSRISWFLRLSDLRKGDSGFSGVVRLEVAASVGAVKAQALAAACAALLPILKGRRALDRRAPQNLLPIGALENFLRRKLGDERLVRRRLEAFVIDQSGG